MTSARALWRLGAGAVLFVGLAISCGGGGDICHCTPTASDTQDYRHAAKHVPLPGSSGTASTVGDILGWPVGSAPPGDAPRSGRELDMFFIAHAYAQFAQIVSSDCDVHVEISATASKTAPRVIVETPVDSEYCDARTALQNALADHGFHLSTDSTELDPPLPVSVLGLAFQDFEHTRGTPLVQTTWELHPAIVTVLPQ